MKTQTSKTKKSPAITTTINKRGPKPGSTRTVMVKLGELQRLFTPEAYIPVPSKFAEANRLNGEKSATPEAISNLSLPPVAVNKIDFNNEQAAS